MISKHGCVCGGSPSITLHTREPTHPLTTSGRHVIT
jgi:hypothetical protein